MQRLMLLALRRLPRSLARRLPLLVAASFFLGAAVAGWTAQALFGRHTDIHTAGISGDQLAELIRDPRKLRSAGGVYEVIALPTRTEAEVTVPLILTLDEARVRAAVVFGAEPPLPNLLAAGPAGQAADARLAALSRAIARQDRNARLVIFGPDDTRRVIVAPAIWHARLGDTWVVLIGLAVFSGVVMSIVPMALNLAAPFDRLARGDEDTPLGPLASSEALQVRDRIERLTDAFSAEQDRRVRGLAAISHDLRTPVTRLRLRTELLRDDALRARFTSDLDEIAGIVDGALDLLSMRFQPEPMHRFSLAALVESLVDDYRDTGRDVSFAPAGPVELASAQSIFGTPDTIRVAATGESIMQGQPDKLRRAFSNLIDNALKYGRRADVTMGPATANSLVVEIRDHGPGIPPDQIDRLMLPFMRGSGTGTARGAGLGLSVASEIVAQHGGSLELINLADGLCVSVQLKRAMPEAS